MPTFQKAIFSCLVILGFLCGTRAEQANPDEQQPIFSALFPQLFDLFDEVFVPFYHDLATYHFPYLLGIQILTITISVRPLTEYAPWLYSFTINTAACVSGGTLLSLLLGETPGWIVHADIMLPLLFGVWYLVHHVPLFVALCQTSGILHLLNILTAVSHTINLAGGFARATALFASNPNPDIQMSFFGPVLLATIGASAGGIVAPLIPTSRWRKLDEAKNSKQPVAIRVERTRAMMALEKPNWWLQSAFWGAIFLALMTGRGYAWFMIPRLLELKRAVPILCLAFVAHTVMRGDRLNDPPLLLSALYRVFFGVSRIPPSSQLISEAEKMEKTKRE